MTPVNAAIADWDYEEVSEGAAEYGGPVGVQHRVVQQTQPQQLALGEVSVEICHVVVKLMVPSTAS